MKTTKIIFCMLAMALAVNTFAQNSTTATIDYKAVKIGNQQWMSQNLDVATFRNGDAIEEIKNQKDWDKAHYSKKPAWCYYKNDSKNGSEYGKLYNFWAVSDPRGLAPEGWHVASNSEWNELITFLGDNTSAGNALRGSSSSSGYNSRSGGTRSLFSGFDNLYDRAYYWTSTPKSDDSGYLKMLPGSNGFIFTYDYFKGDGMSVRCVKD